MIDLESNQKSFVTGYVDRILVCAGGPLTAQKKCKAQLEVTNKHTTMATTYLKYQSC